MTGSPWAGPSGAATPVPGSLPSAPGQAPTGSLPSPPAGGSLAGPAPTWPIGGPPVKGGRWRLLVGMAVMVLGAITGTALVTYSLVHHTGRSAPVTSGSLTTSPAVPQRQYSAADQAAAKQRVCRIFDVSARGEKGQGGMRAGGELNVPLTLRTLNSVVAVQNALSPATPPEVAATAHKYIDRNLDLTTAVMGNVSVEEGDRLNDIANTATFAFADVCGLPH